ncbi:glucan synthase subunit [Scheffersomyces xylosifermentans]|uniref:glucan synthase subunit n=1 Tax=Scheffersomyces xylosifermentans TaxID=1304137 RepID=UPI00315CA56A
MSRRDLTSNAPPRLNVTHADDDDSFDSPHNPFLTHNELDSSHQQSSEGSSRSSLSSSKPEADAYGRPFNAFNGYYSKNGTSANLLSGGESSSEDNNLNHNGNNYNNINNNSSNINSNSGSVFNLGNSSPSISGINVPPEYDRYPSMAGSRVVSSTSLTNFLNKETTTGANTQIHSQATSQYGGDDSSSFSNNSSNPFAHNTDFSPFGGYPATSFPLYIDEKEPDDYLHNPDPVADAEYDKNRFIYDLKNMDKRSLGGLLGLILLGLGAACVFIILPVFTYSNAAHHMVPQSYEILTDYSYPLLSAIRTSLIDPDTPEEALSYKAQNGDTWTLVFSDEFNAEGRTFYEGDDQFFTAPDLHYDATKDLEWYDPDAVTTSNGTLTLRMDAFKNHDLYYRSGMVQSWNKMCFTQGKIEYSARLPNYGSVMGLWPGLWTMGNLGRPGYLATTDGVWPYSYESCDVGITPNQSSPDGISYLPGQRLNSCTCPGSDHPNPGVGRGAPEIDAIEGEVAKITSGVNTGLASQSLQLAPFDIWYIPDYDFIQIHNSSTTVMNTYAGGPFQQALSAVTTLNNTWYERGDGDHNYQRYGFEYLNDNDNGYLTWFVGEDPTMTVHATALHPNGNIGWRRLSKEPMAMIMNFGISNNWAYIDWPSLVFPMTMRVDYVRVYQPNDSINVGCDPADYPTYDYIQSHLNIYENVNLTSFADGGYSFPKNKLVHGC